MHAISRRLWIGVSGAAFCTAPALGDIVLLTQERTAYAKSYDFRTFPNPTLHEQWWSATDFGPGEADLEPIGGMAEAHHRSTLSPGLITATSETRGNHGLQTWFGAARLRCSSPSGWRARPPIASAGCGK